jgi:hypothetical protein
VVVLMRAAGEISALDVVLALRTLPHALHRRRTSIAKQAFVVKAAISTFVAT